MNHFALIVVIILSIEILIRFNLLNRLNLIIILINKASKIIISKNISDHWKEKVIPKYSIKIMKFSLHIFVMLISICCIFFIVNIINTGFLSYLFSIQGIIESTLIAFGYLYLRRVINV